MERPVAHKYQQNDHFGWGELDDKAIDSLDPNLAFLDDYTSMKVSQCASLSIGSCSSSSYDASPSKVHENESCSSDDVIRWNPHPFLLENRVDFDGTINIHQTRLPPISCALANIQSYDTNYEYHLRLLEVEEEIKELLKSATDPIAKFLRKWNLSALDVIELNIYEELLGAPRKPREKYGKRKDLNPEERLVSNRERNREHARATRRRKRVFGELEVLLTQRGYHPIHRED